MLGFSACLLAGTLPLEPRLQPADSLFAEILNSIFLVVARYLTLGPSCLWRLSPCFLFWIFEFSEPDRFPNHDFYHDFYSTTKLLLCKRQCKSSRSVWQNALLHNEMFFYGGLLESKPFKCLFRRMGNEVVPMCLVPTEGMSSLQITVLLN